MVDFLSSPYRFGISIPSGTRWFAAQYGRARCLPPGVVQCLFANGNALSSNWRPDGHVIMINDDLPTVTHGFRECAESPQDMFAFRALRRI
jgi:hypothetical protein